MVGLEFTKTQKVEQSLWSETTLCDLIKQVQWRVGTQLSLVGGVCLCLELFSTPSFLC